MGSNTSKKSKCPICETLVETDKILYGFLMGFVKRISLCPIWNGQLQNFKAEAKEILKRINEK